MMFLGKKGRHLSTPPTTKVNHLGSWVEGENRNQINNLTTMVNNPFYGINTDPNSILSEQQIPQYMLDIPWPQFPGGVLMNRRQCQLGISRDAAYRGEALL